MADTPVLSRMIRPAPPPGSDAETGLARAWRLAVPKLAEDTLGLVASVGGVDTRTCGHEALLADWSDDTLTFLLVRPGDDAARGLCVVDAGLRAALIEVQTTGRMTGQPPRPRPGTDVDLALIRDILWQWVGAVAVTSGATPAAWQPGPRVASARIAAMALEEAPFTVTEITFAFADGLREGRLRIAVPGLPDATERVLRRARGPVAGLAPFAGCEAPLQVVLCERSVSLGTLQALAVGSEIDLPHASLGEVAIRSEDGAPLVRGRLGRMGDRKAVKLTGPGSPVSPPDRAILSEGFGPGLAGDPPGGMPGASPSGTD